MATADGGPETEGIGRLLAGRSGPVMLTETQRPPAAAQRLARLGVAAVTFASGAGWRGGADLSGIRHGALGVLDAGLDGGSGD